MAQQFVQAEEAVAQIAAGRMVVVVDDEAREHAGDLVLAAEFVTPDAVNFMVTHGRGFLCLALTPERCDTLELPLMSRRGSAGHERAFTISIEARDGVTTGISAADRARTIAVAADPTFGASDIVRPGHIHGLRACPGGVLERPGHAEAAVDLARLAGRHPAGVTCEILDRDGAPARQDVLRDFCALHGLSMVTVAALAAHRRRREGLVERIASARLPTRHGTFEIVGYRERGTGAEHVALVHGSVAGRTGVLARLHSQCLTGDAFGSTRCDCGGQLDDALRRIAREGKGVLVHLAQEGRGIGLVEKIRAYALQDHEGLDTVDANLALGHAVDARDFGVGADILHDLGVRSVRLMTNNPAKERALVEHGVRVAARIPHGRRPTCENIGYLEAKRDRLGHQLATEHHGLRLALTQPTPQDEGPADERWLPGVDMAV